MREIKFRVWDKVEKKMYYPETLISSPWMMSLDGHVYNVYLQQQAQYNWTKRVVVLQYTGLKDKNGKEIWEGDVVKIADNFSGQIFDRLGCWFVEMGKELGYYPQCDTEVIGNIYEKPELVK